MRKGREALAEELTRKPTGGLRSIPHKKRSTPEIKLRDPCSFQTDILNKEYQALPRAHLSLLVPVISLNKNLDANTFFSTDAPIFT